MFEAQSIRLRAVRGATCVPQNTPEAVEAAMVPLLDQLLANHPGLGPDAVVSMFFTVTPDLTCVSPAKVARLHLGWDTVAMMCSQEPVIEGLPERCIRLMIQFYTPLPQKALRPVYLAEAATLRPDLT